MRTACFMRQADPASECCANQATSLCLKHCDLLPSCWRHGVVLYRGQLPCTGASQRISVESDARNLSPLLLPCAQGRFSGRLASKADEKALVLECRKLGPLLGGVTKYGI